MPSERRVNALETPLRLSLITVFVGFMSFQMQRWVDQAKNKLTAIIEEAKKHKAVGELRVAFVG